MKKRYFQKLLIFLFVFSSLILTACKGVEPSEQVPINISIEIECGEILNNMESLKPGIAPFVPKDGVILPKLTLSAFKGDSVLDILNSVKKSEKISVILKGSYIVSIANIAEFDCGTQSGWKYTVNGKYPSVSSNQYSLVDGDEIVWTYALAI